jgi:hypothetical protein
MMPAPIEKLPNPSIHCRTSQPKPAVFQSALRLSFTQHSLGQTSALQALVRLLLDVNFGTGTEAKTGLWCLPLTNPKTTEIHSEKVNYVR